jgi:tetratricopeptide (TPR) repeat protein
MRVCSRWLAPVLGICLGCGCGGGGDAVDTDKARLASAQQLVQAGRSAQALGVLQQIGATQRDAGVLYDAALLQQLAGDVPAAIASLQRATRLDPVHARARGQLATMLALSGRPDEARIQALELIQRSPNSHDGPLLFAALAGPEDVSRAIDALEALRARLAAAEQAPELELLLALADAYDRIGQRARTEVFAPAFERARLASPSGALQLALVYGQTERRAVSEALLRAVGETEPGLPVWTPLAAVALELRHLELARFALAQLPEAARKRPEAQLLRGSLDLETGQVEQAVAELEAALAALPAERQSGARLLLARAFVRKAEPARAEAELRAVQRAGALTGQAQLLLAELLRQRGDGAAALRELQPLLSDPELNEEAFGKLVALHTERGELVAAQHWCERWLEQHPSHPGAMLGLAHLALAQRRTEHAVELLEAVLAAHPGHVRALEVLTSTWLANAAPERARQAIEAQLERTPSAELLDFAAAYFEAHDDPAKAELLYRQRMTLDAVARGPLARLASLLRRQGRVADALPFYQQALALPPVDAALALEAAPLEVAAGAFAEAIVHYEQALSAGARGPQVLSDLAYVYAEHGQRLERALELALDAHSQLPDSPGACHTLGWVYLRRGDYSQALPLLQRAAQALPSQASVTYHLGLAELAAGNLAAGKRALQRCLTQRPEDELERDARHALASAGTRRDGRAAL